MPLPPEVLEQLAQARWRQPWARLCLDNPKVCTGLERELAAELGDKHVLFPFRRVAMSIARRDDNDDVLYWMGGAELPFAVVHLTWGRHPEPNPLWPSVVSFRTFSEFFESQVIVSS